ncbi:MAG: hypothetical protein Q9213_003472 [Squamulea squamosa]
MAQSDPSPLLDSDIQLLRCWNGTVPQPEPRCVHDLVQEQTRGYPDSLAVCSWDGELTYHELDSLSSQLAHRLVDIGTTAEQIVPLCFEKSQWAVVSMIAVLKAGAAFTFIDPSHPMDRMQSIIQDTDATLLLASPSVISLFASKPKPFKNIIEVTTTLVESVDISQCPPLPMVRPNDAAVVLFTSGSTGRPKGIVQEHSTAAFCAQTCARVYDIHPGCRVLQWAAYCFDMSVIDMLMTLVGGGCVCIPSEEMRLNSLAGTMRQMKVGCSVMTPSVAQIIKSAVLPDLRTLVLGGEAVSRDHLEGWSSNVRIINGYGPGEASICVAGDASIDCPSMIGKAISSVVWITDESSHKQLAPVGTIGEILIEGPLLARGYLNDPTKTALSFIEDPPWLFQFRKRSEKPIRLYKTGDLGRYNKDGLIEYMGRKDYQIKLRGQRIEPGDIEYHINKFWPTHEAIVVDAITRHGASGTCNLAAFVGYEGAKNMDQEVGTLTTVDGVRKEKLSSLLDDLHERLLSVLPTYMIPTYVIPLRFLPLTTSGKLDRKLLRSIGSRLRVEQLLVLGGSSQSYSEHGCDRTLEPMETRIAELWLKVLPTERLSISPNDSFFKLGGDSIHAMQLVAAAKAVNINLTTRMIFQHPTLTDLSSVALRATTVNGTAVHSTNGCALRPRKLGTLVGGMYCPEFDLDTAEIEDIEELPDLQSFMVVSGLLKTHGYINYFSFDLTGPLDTSRLAASCRMLVERHAILRTVFALYQAQVYQVVKKRYDPGFVYYSSHESTEALLASFCHLDQCCESRLGDNIVKILLVERGADKHTLFMRISHAQFDGVSLGILYRDLQMLYTKGVLDPAPRYIDWARASKRASSTEAEQYWRALLIGASMTNLFHYSRVPYRYVIDSRISTFVSFASVKEHGITIATLIKAAWAVVLAELSSNTDIVFGNAVSGRNLSVSGVDQVVGDCHNSVLVRARLDKAPTVLSLLNQIQDQLVAAIPYESIGYRKVIEKCTDWPRWTRFSTSVNHQNYTNAGQQYFRLGQAECRVSYNDLESDRRDIQIYSYPPNDDGLIQLEMKYSEKALATDTVRKILQRFGETLQRLSDNVNAPLSLLSSPIGRTTPLDIATVPHELACSKTELYPLPRLRTFQFAFSDPSAIVDKVWQSFGHLCEIDEVPGSRKLRDDEPFYHLRGDLVYATQFSAWYWQEGIDFSMEALLENPTRESQKALLSSTLLSKPRKDQTMYRKEVNGAAETTPL